MIIFCWINKVEVQLSIQQVCPGLFYFLNSKYEGMSNKNNPIEVLTIKKIYYDSKHNPFLYTLYIIMYYFTFF